MKVSKKTAAELVSAKTTQQTVVEPSAQPAKADALAIVKIEESSQFDAATACSQFATNPTLTVFKMLFVLWVADKMRKGASVFIDLKNWVSFHEFCNIVNVTYNGAAGSKSMYPRNVAGAIDIDYKGFAAPFYQWLLAIRNKEAQPVINGKRIAYDNGRFIVKFEATEIFSCLDEYKGNVNKLVHEELTKLNAEEAKEAEKK